MDVILLTGFLGAGKTTLVKRLLRTPEWANRTAVIVNDLSALEVDGELIRLTDSVSERDGTLVSITDGSISGRRHAEFTEALAGMARRGVSQVLVEASGSTAPAPLLAAIRATPGARVRAVVALVDTRALWHDHEGGPALLQAIEAAESRKLPVIELLLAAQLRSATLIALSKTDLVPPACLPLIERTLQAINPAATLTACVHGRLEPRLLNPAQAPPEAVTSAQSPPEFHESFDVGSTVVADPRPLHPTRFHRLYHERLGVGIHRSKGFLWLASRPDDVLLWNQAGGAFGLEWLGTWRVALLSDPQLLAEERAEIERRLAAAHPVFADRVTELTVIGPARDRAIFCEELKGCFCSGAEIAAWRRGDAFPDPWPRNQRAF